MKEKIMFLLHIIGIRIFTALIFLFPIILIIVVMNMINNAFSEGYNKAIIDVQNQELPNNFNNCNCK